MSSVVTVTLGLRGQCYCTERQTQDVSVITDTSTGQHLSRPTDLPDQRKETLKNALRANTAAEKLAECKRWVISTRWKMFSGQA